MKKIPAPDRNGDVHRYEAKARPARGLVLFFHGFGLHADKFTSLYALINELGYDLVAHDLWGHGRWRASRLTAEEADVAIEHSLAVYRAFAAEHPLLLGVGLYGGFMMDRIMAATVGDDWRPPSILYSVDPAPVPLSVLQPLVRRPSLLAVLDRFKFGYDTRLLTHDAADNLGFVDDDPTCWSRFPVGLSLLAGHAVNAFYAAPNPDYAKRHAILYGTDNQLAPIAAVRDHVARHPDRFRLYEVEGGALHLHRDAPPVQERFRRQLEAALAYVTDERAAPRPPEVPASGANATARRLLDLMFDPIGTIDRAIADHGSCFTLRIPFDITPPFTFLTTRDGYRQVLDLPPEVGRNGPVIDRVPALAQWTPRSDPSPEHLQRLLLAGRRFIGQRLRRDSPSAMKTTIGQCTQQSIRSWPEQLDLNQALVALIHETSARLVLGDELWSALGPRTLADVRKVTHAVDAARATLALSPAARLLPEYRATRRLGRRMLELARTAPSSPFARDLADVKVKGASLPVEDAAWMMFFALWNATLYTGTYGAWFYLDLLNHPEALAQARRLADDREAFLTSGLVETMRLNPISWQLRSLASDVVVRAEQGSVEVPAGHFLSVFSHRLNRDPAIYADPLAWNPSRYDDGAPAPLLFGTGPFSCVAQRWVKALVTSVVSTLIDEVDVTLRKPLPRRLSRVHLLYPRGAIPATVCRRQ